MYVSRELLQQREVLCLAPYAQRSVESLGREYPEPQHTFRTDFQRDRERIVHTPSFRRLEYKTQVFLNGTGDHYRTRLTHTIEVASITRSVARTLRLNEDLAEAIALAHDLGHSPFGHSGEKALNAMMAEHGGFDHNQQSIRVVELLEQRYPEFPGLNLTYEVREGLRKHLPPPPESERSSPSLEAQLADVTDDLTYCAHDVDDGLEAGLIQESDLAGIDLWQEARERVRSRYPELDPAHFRHSAVRSMIDLQIERLITFCNDQLDRFKIRFRHDVHRRPFDQPVICFSPEDAARHAQLRSFLYANLYYSPAVSEVNHRAMERIERLFAFYLQQPGQIGRQSRQHIEESGLHRAVCDYMAGMTDRYADLEYQRLFEV